MDPKAGQQENQTQASAETKNTETHSEYMIPKSRLDEALDRAKQAEAKAAALEQVEIERKRKEAEAAGRWQELVEELRPLAERTSQLEETLNSYLLAELETVPEDMRDLVPAGDAAHRLAWIQTAKARGLFNPPTAPETDAGQRGDKPKQTGIKLTAEQLDMARRTGMTPEQYAAQLERIRLIAG